MPPSRTLHISNPRWTDIPPADRLRPDDQRTWEKRHYRNAVHLGETGLGAVVFWVPAESPTAPVPNDPGRAYGQGTGREFSEVIGMREMAPFDVQVVLGIDPNHSGRGLHEYYHTAKEFGIPIHSSFGAVLNAAVQLVMR